ncbi:MAG TPA: Ig-like domain-containing protein [Candidatus Dojkabacteria bacterium]|nr:Ig-like domain-containing protein [Candidatus Dojkabacteria bacterium]
MAKKKSKSSIQTASKNIPQKKESMVSKIEIKKPQDQERVSRIVGTIFIVLGVLLISFGIYSFIKYNRNPEINTTYEAPVIVGVNTLTNQGSVVIRGSASGYDQVFIYVDGEEVARTKVTKDGSYEYTVDLVDEGKYAVTVAGVKGFPRRYISPISEVLNVTVDKTAPTISKIKYPAEVGTETFSLTGVVEPNAVVTVKRGTGLYRATCDEKGNFKISGIVLEKGPNVFNIELKDEAGNETKVEDKIRVIYSEDSDVNGEAVDDSSIPVAAGELSDAMSTLLGNKLMIIFGILALIGMFSSTGILLYKNRKA